MPFCSGRRTATTRGHNAPIRQPKGSTVPNTLFLTSKKNTSSSISMTAAITPLAVNGFDTRARSGVNGF